MSESSKLSQHPGGLYSLIRCYSAAYYMGSRGHVRGHDLMLCVCRSPSNLIGIVLPGQVLF